MIQTKLPNEVIQNSNIVTDAPLNNRPYVRQNGDWKTISSNYFNYSLEETVQGTWINGKTIYKKVLPVISGSEVNVNNTIFDVNDLRIEHLIGLGGFYITQSDALVLANMYTIGTVMGTWINKNGYLTERHNLSNLSNSVGYIILEYTKLDD